MADNTFPIDWRDQPCFIAAIPRPLVPYVAGLLKIAENRGFWLSEGDFSRGYEAVIELEEHLMSCSILELTDRLDAQYRLLNTAIYGVTYETITTDPLVVEPPIAPHVTVDIHDYESIMGRLERMIQLVDNRIAGTETPLYSDLPGIKQQLEDLIAAVEASAADDTEVLETLISILGALA